MRSEDLIKALTADATPIRRLASPMTRLVVWLFVSTAYVAVIVGVMGLRPDLPSRLTEARFVAELGGTFMTSVLAAAAAFCAGCPGRPIWERFAPLPALFLWLLSLGEGCWRSFVQAGAQGLQFRLDLACFPSILLVSIVPAFLILILIVIRRGAPIAPVTTTALGTLAAAALGANSLRLFHTQDASAMILIWQFGSVALLAGFGTLMGRQILPCPKPRIAMQPAGNSRTDI